jgi:RimJ/RimL family protein N-acetyltransferase
MTSMAWQTTGDVAEFLAAAGPYLRREHVRNTVILTVTETMRVSAAHSGEPDEAGVDPATRPLLGWWPGPDEPAAGSAAPVTGAFLHTPRFPVVLTDVAPAVAAELAAVTLAGRPLPGVNARPEVARAFAAAWQRANGGAVHVHRNQRLYRLAGLSWPDPAPAGAARIADDSDLPLLAQWFAAFEFEVHEVGRGSDQAAAARERIGYQGLTIWEAGGEPVAMAGATRQVAGMARIGPVYTPPAHRGRGYGSAATAAASQRLLDHGAEDVVLFTDLANPVSNSIYQRIGYRPVEDRVSLEFRAD